MTFAEEVKDKRKLASMTQRDAAELLSVPLKTLQAWEQGVRTPPAYLRKMILDQLNNKTAL